MRRPVSEPEVWRQLSLAGFPFVCHHQSPLHRACRLVPANARRQGGPAFGGWQSISPKRWFS